MFCLKNYCETLIFLKDKKNFNSKKLNTHFLLTNKISIPTKLISKQAKNCLSLLRVELLKIEIKNKYPWENICINKDTGHKNLQTNKIKLIQVKILLLTLLQELTKIRTKLQKIEINKKLLKYSKCLTLIKMEKSPQMPLISPNQNLIFLKPFPLCYAKWKNLTKTSICKNFMKLLKDCFR